MCTSSAKGPSFAFFFVLQSSLNLQCPVRSSVIWPSHVQHLSGIGKTYTMLCSFTRAIRNIMPIQFRRICLYSVRLSSLLYVIYTTNARIYRYRHAPLLKLISPRSAFAALSESTQKCSLSLKTLVVVLGE